MSASTAFVKQNHKFPVTCTCYLLPLVQVWTAVCQSMYGVGEARARQMYADHLKEVTSVEAKEAPLVVF